MGTQIKRMDCGSVSLTINTKLQCTYKPLCCVVRSRCCSSQLPHPHQPTEQLIKKSAVTHHHRPGMWVQRCKQGGQELGWEHKEQRWRSRTSAWLQNIIFSPSLQLNLVYLNPKYPLSLGLVSVVNTVGLYFCWWPVASGVDTVRWLYSWIQLLSVITEDWLAERQLLSLLKRWCSLDLPCTRQRVSTWFSAKYTGLDLYLLVWILNCGH